MPAHGFIICSMIALVSCANYNPDNENVLTDPVQTDQDITSETDQDISVDTTGKPADTADEPIDTTSSVLDTDGAEPETRFTPTAWSPVSGGRRVLGKHHQCYVTVGGSPSAMTSGTKHRAVVGIGATVSK